jgi:hypothetical protein
MADRFAVPAFTGSRTRFKLRALAGVQALGLCLAPDGLSFLSLSTGHIGEVTTAGFGLCERASGVCVYPGRYVDIRRFEHHYIRHLGRRSELALQLPSFYLFHLRKLIVEFQTLLVSKRI